jgi:hypothetical protein
VDIQQMHIFLLLLMNPLTGFDDVKVRAGLLVAKPNNVSFQYLQHQKKMLKPFAVKVFRGNPPLQPNH